MAIVPCYWKHWWTPTASVEPAAGPPTGSGGDRPPAAVVWTGSTKLMGKPLKTSTSIHWSAMHASVYAAIPPGKQIRLVCVREDIKDAIGGPHHPFIVVERLPGEADTGRGVAMVRVPDRPREALLFAGFQ